MPSEMKTYLVSAHITISLSTRVQANSEEEAKELAMARDLQDISDITQDRNADREIWITSGELDGVPEIQSVELIPEEPKKKRLTL